MEHGAEIPFYLKVSGSIDMTSRANEIQVEKPVEKLQYGFNNRNCVITKDESGRKNIECGSKNPATITDRLASFLGIAHPDHN